MDTHHSMKFNVHQESWMNSMVTTTCNDCFKELNTNNNNNNILSLMGIVGN